MSRRLHFSIFDSISLTKGFSFFCSCISRERFKEILRFIRNDTLTRRMCKSLNTAFASAGSKKILSRSTIERYVRSTDWGCVVRRVKNKPILTKKNVDFEILLTFRKSRIFGQNYCILLIPTCLLARCLQHQRRYIKYNRYQFPFKFLTALRQ